MDLKMLLENFEVIAEAENGIQRLRELILDLAIRGKLVEQKSSKEDSELVHHQILEERQELVNKKKIRSPKKLPVVREEEKIYEIPSHWKWIRLNDAGDWGAGSTPLRSNSNYYQGSHNWFKSGELPDGFLDGPSEETITDLALKECSLRQNQPGDLLIAMYGATIGKLAILSCPGTTNQAVCGCTCFTGIYNRYLFTYLLALRKDLTLMGAGAAQPNISRVKIINTPFPLPPTEEQKRIVKKIDELMELCDRAEARKKNRNELQQQLRRSAIHALETAETEEDFKKSWHFVRENFSAISQTQSDVQSLRELVLDAGMRGKLTLQDYKNESANKLIKCIQESKILKQKQKKRSNNRNKLLSISPEDIPFQIPDNWKWIRLHEICWLITDGAHHTPQYVKSGVPFISVKDISKGYLNFSDTKFISHETHLELCSRCHPERGDILLTKVGTTGIAVEVDTDKDFSIFVSVALLKIFPDYTYPRFVCYLLNSSLVRKQSEGGTEGIGNKNLVLRKIYNFLVVLPPLEEQKRIVSKVDELMEYCDRVEQNLSKKEELASAISASIIHHLET